MTPAHIHSHAAISGPLAAWRVVEQALADPAVRRALADPAVPRDGPAADDLEDALALLRGVFRPYAAPRPSVSTQATVILDALLRDGSETEAVRALLDLQGRLTAGGEPPPPSPYLDDRDAYHIGKLGGELLRELLQALRQSEQQVRQGGPPLSDADLDRLSRLVGLWHQVVALAHLLYGPLPAIPLEAP